MDLSQAVAEQPVSDRQEKRGTFLSWKLLLLVGLMAAVYYNVVWRLILQWSNDPNFSHGFIVPLFSAFIVWTKRKELAALPVKPCQWGLPVIAGSLMLMVLGTLGAEIFVARVSLILLLAGIILFLLGWRHFKELLFPWTFLFLMIPIPAIIFSQMTLPLQTLAAKLAAAALQLVGIPVFREGNIIMLPAMPLEVAEACSGIRSLLSLGTLAIIYGYFTEQRVSLRVILAFAAIPIAVLANGFRIFGTGIMVQYWNPERALGFFHEFSGWLVFLVSMCLLFMIQKALSFSSKVAVRGGTR